MQILDNIIILVLPVLAFIAGKRMSDKYNADKIRELEYMLRLNAAERGVGYIAPQPVRKYAPIGQEFMDKLRENGRATQKVSRTEETK